MSNFIYYRHKRNNNIMDEKEKRLNINGKVVRNLRFNKIEWFNYFNNEITIESINNNINDLNDISNIKIEIIKNILTNKKNNIVQRNKKRNKNIFIYDEKTIDNTTYNKLIINNNRKKKTKIKNMNNKNYKSKRIGKNNTEISEKSKINMNNNHYLEKSMDKLNKNSIIKNIYRSDRYYYDYSYVKRFKLKKSLKSNRNYRPSKERAKITKNNIIIERTLPEMHALNNYGLVNDKEYEIYKKINNMKYKRYI